MVTVASRRTTGGDTGAVDVCGALAAVDAADGTTWCAATTVTDERAVVATVKLRARAIDPRRARVGFRALSANAGR
jgi:hypothetical protein